MAKKKTSKKAEKQTLRLLPDVPFGEIADGAEDGLGFDQYATILARAALDTPEPFTIGVYGGWGSGKTSLMRMIQNNIEAESDAIGVWFNAWRYEKEEHLIIPLLATIITEMDRRREGFKESLKDGFTKLRDAFRGVLYGVSVKGKIGIPGLSEAELSVSPKDMFERYEKLSEMATDRILDQSLYFRSFGRLDEIAQDPTTPKLIIFVDDLDRCFPDKAVALLEGVKLVLNQPNITFVLGIAPRIIQAYLSAKYKKEYGIDPKLYEDYLDKLVQLPFAIPEIRENVADYARSLLKRVEVFGEITKEEFEDEYEPLVSICGPACKDNPRAIIRFLNRLLILTRVHEQKESKTKISLVHFGITNALQMNWQSIYNSCEQDRQIPWDTTGEVIAGKENLCALLGSLFRQSESDAGLVDRLEAYGKDESNPERSLFQTLATDESLRRLLSSKPGLEWLSEPKLRKEAVATTQQVKNVSETAPKPHKYVLEGATSYTEDGWPVVRDWVIEPGADLQGADLHVANLNRARLQGACLQGAILEGAVLRGADLQRAIFYGACLEGADLKGAHLQGAVFQNARLQGANLQGASLQGAVFRGAEYNEQTVWPEDFDAEASGAVMR